jgi:CRP-like cAMP-binding protein
MSSSHGLSLIPIFASLEPSDLEHLAAIAVSRSLDPGEHLFFDGDPSEGFFAVESGRIKVYKMAPDGREQVLHLVGPGHTFALASLFGEAAYLANAEAVQHSKLWLIPKDPFLELLQTEPELALKLLAYLAGWMKRLLSLVETLSLKNVEARLAEYLLARAEEAGDLTDEGIVITFDVEKKMVASRIGTISETFSRTLKKLKDRGLIREEDSRIIITDITGLKKMSTG